MPPDRQQNPTSIVAILRGITTDKVVEIGQVLFDAGIRSIEVPLNSPDPFTSIERLCAKLGDACLCGAGTVLTPEDVDRVRDAGGRLVVAPNTDAGVIQRALANKMVAMPGIATATEAFTAIKAGASHLKLFPASTYGAGHIKALKAVLPPLVQVYAVGGIGAAHVGEWLAAGAAGFGFGSEIFKPEYSVDEIGRRARGIVDAVQHALAQMKT